MSCDNSCNGAVGGRAPTESPVAMTPVETRLPFPDGIAFAAGCLKEGAAPDPLPEERALLSERATPKRVREFALARHCAREAMARLGIEGAHGLPILRAGTRAPRWPAGLVGSITHNGAMAAAVVARNRDYLGIGIDLERARPVSQRLTARIALPNEQAWLDGLPHTERSIGFALLFSAKESIYKAINPITGVYLGFHDVRVDLKNAPAALADLRQVRLWPAAASVKRFAWELRIDAGSGFPAGYRGRVYWDWAASQMLTGVWIGA